MQKKKLWIPLAVLVLLALGAALWIFLAGQSPYTYTMTLTDAGGREINSIKQMSPGDTVYVTVVMNGPKKAKTLDVYGLESTLTVSGMQYCGDGKPFANEACASYKKQLVSGTETVDFLYYDVNGQGITISNPCTLGTCSFVVSDPAEAAAAVTTALIYPKDTGSACEIKAK